jgi:hypothetical protein
MISRRTAFRALPGALLLAAGCAPGPARLAARPEEGGIGGSGLSGGGTEEGGIGGTGLFGTLTAPGPLTVNGLRLATWSGTAVESLAHRGPPLLPGDTLAAEAVREGGGLLATRLAVFHPLVGPLAAHPQGGFAVLGTRLVLPPGTPLRGPAGEPLPASRLRAGHAVAVTGVWQGASVVASALRLLPAAPRAVLRGQLRRDGAALGIGGTALDPRGLPADLPGDRFVTAEGVPGPAGLIVERLEERPLAVFAGRIGALAAEGYAAPNRGAPGLHLSGFGLPLDPAGGEAALRPGERQLLLGRLAGGFRVEAGIVLPAAPAARAAALADPAAAAAIARWLAA